MIFKVLTPEEINKLVDEILAEAQCNIPESAFIEVNQKTRDFKKKWEKSFSKFGRHHKGELCYQDLIIDFNNQITKIKKYLDNQSKNKIEANKLFNSYTHGRIIKRSIKCTENITHCPKFRKPLIIVSAPRAGSTLLFEIVCQFKEIWSIREESHELIEGIKELHPKSHNYISNRLTEADALPHIESALKKRFTSVLQNRDGIKYIDSNPKAEIRFLEKTPKNVLRIPFLKAIFPDALFIFIYRDPKENISSIIEGWRSRKFVSYANLPHWPYKEWSFLLIPGWESLHESSIAEIAACQWMTANTYILDDLNDLPPSMWYTLSYSDLIQDRKKIIYEISQFAGLSPDNHIEEFLSKSLPISRLSISEPEPDKWRKNEILINEVLPRLDPIIRRLENLKQRSGQQNAF